MGAKLHTHNKIAIIKMKYSIYIMLAVLLAACNGNVDTEKSVKTMDSIHPSSKDNSSRANSTYSNARFKDIIVKKTGEYTYTVSGKGQIFEANFGWSVEDGHEELESGVAMTDAGAPAWGSFRFTVEVHKDRPNSSLTLILFEPSAEDGSRQHELAIALE